MLKIVLSIFFVLISFALSGQNLGWRKYKKIVFNSDSALVDSFVIQPNTLQCYSDISDSCYTLNYSNSYIYKHCSVDSIFISYFILPLKIRTVLNDPVLPTLIPSSYFLIENRYQNENTEIKSLSSDIDIVGDFSKGMLVSTNGQVNMNNQLDLAINGKIGDSTILSAIIRDKQIPVQPSGITTTLEELEQIYASIENPYYKVEAGDFLLKQNRGLLNIDRKINGLSVHTYNKVYKQSSMYSKVKGEFRRQNIVAVTGSYGPYRLIGNNNEFPIIVLSNSEKVYINGKLLSRGFEKDYTIDYNNGELFFTEKQLISSDLRIVVEFEYKTALQSNSFFHHSEINLDNWSFSADYFLEQQSKLNFIQSISDSSLLEQLYSSNLTNNTIQVPSFSEAKIEKGSVYYCLKDTLLNDTLIKNIFELSSDTSKTLYTVNFNFVGENKGNYQRINEGTNYSTFQWVSSLSGDYDAVVNITLAQKKQWFQASVFGQIGKRASLSAQFLYSHKDNNRLSPSNMFIKSSALDVCVNDTIIWRNSYKSHVKFSVYSQSENLELPKPIFDTEFMRNWNLPLSFLDSAFQNALVSIDLSRNNRFSNEIQLSSLSKKQNILAYQIKNISALNRQKVKYLGKVFFTNNFLEKQKENFSKWTQNINFKTDRYSVYLEQLAEKKQLNKNLSVSFIDLKSGITKNDSLSKNFDFYLTYKNELNSLDSLIRYKKVNYSTHFLAAKKFGQNNFQSSLIWQIESTDMSKKEQFYKLKFADSWQNKKKYFNGNISVEANSTKESVQIEQFVKVPNGQGYFVWIDYNQNGLQELGEFEQSVFSFDANYLRFYRPSNSFGKYFTYNYNFGFGFSGQELKMRKSFLNSTIQSFLIKFSYLENQKTSDLLRDQEDKFSNRVSYNKNLNLLIKSSLRKIVLSGNYSSNLNYSIFLNGGEQKNIEKFVISGNYKLNSIFSIDLSNKFLDSKISNLFYPARNYSYLSNIYNASLNAMYKHNFQFNIYSSYNEFFNEINEPIGTIKIIRFESVGKRNTTDIKMAIKYLKINYLLDFNTPMSYEILQNHKNGNNIDIDLALNFQLGRIWSLSLVYQAQSNNVHFIQNGSFIFNAKF